MLSSITFKTTKLSAMTGFNLSVLDPYTEQNEEQSEEQNHAAFAYSPTEPTAPLNSTSR